MQIVKDLNEGGKGKNIKSCLNIEKDFGEIPMLLSAKYNC